jgi:hypothetical protein
VNFCGFDVQKGKFLAAEKFALCSNFSKLCSGEALLAASVRFLECSSGKKRPTVLIN